jgi:hypothetical protein
MIPHQLMGELENVQDSSAPDTLATHLIATIVRSTDGGTVLSNHKGMSPEAKHLGLYQLLGFSPEVMHPIKTLSRWRSVEHSD